MRRKACSLALALPVFGFLTSGCATYLRNRTADVADIVSVEASVGHGAHVNFQVTDFFGTGLGFSKQRGIAMHGRYIGSSTRESGGLLVMNMSGTESDGTQMRPMFSGSRKYADMQAECLHIYDDTRGSMWCIIPMELAWNGPALYLASTKKRWWRILDVSLGASALIGFNLCISPGEIADCVLGVVGLDMAGDDVRSNAKARQGSPNADENNREHPTTGPTVPPSAGASGGQ